MVSSCYDRRPPPALGPVPLTSWMGSLAPVLGNASVLDLRLPGTHDTLTYDLSLKIADGAIDEHPRISALLHWLDDIGVVPDLVNGWIRRQAVTQALNV